MNTQLPLRRVKRILESNVNGVVCNDSCRYVRDFCEDILKRIAIASYEELREENKLREFHNQYTLRRIPLSIFKKVLEDLYKQIFGLKDGDVGNAPESVTTTLSEADERWYYA